MLPTVHSKKLEKLAEEKQKESEKKLVTLLSDKFALSTDDSD